MTGLPPPEASGRQSGSPLPPGDAARAPADAATSPSATSRGRSSNTDRLAGSIIAAIIFGLIALVVLIPALLDDGDDLSTDRLAAIDPADQSQAPAVDTEAAPTTLATTIPTPTQVLVEVTPTEPEPATTPPPTSTAPEAATDTYPTLPDGSPAPIVAIFDVDTITLSGWVPSVESADWLKALAIANSNFPDAEIVDELTIDPSVPLNIGVRVIELNSPRFPEGSASVVEEHALQLDRVATVMNALPNVTVIVVGHADQRGDNESNYLLSEDRAQAVVRYLVTQGIEPSRLASRAVGEEELLTLDRDQDALELNRRTEFIFYGLLAAG